MKRIILFFCLLTAYTFGQADSTIVQLQAKTTTDAGDFLVMSESDTDYFKITYGNFLAEVFADTRGDGTVSNGDDTKYPTEDDVYDFVTGLGYITDGNTNWNNTYGFYSTAEEIEDIIGAMLTGNTETNITVTYQDTDGTIDFVISALGLDSLEVVATIYQYLADSSYTSTWTGAQIDSLLNILHTNDGLWLTSVLLPSSANPTTDATGETAIDSDDKFIEFYDGTASRILPAIQIANYTILYPDSVQPRSDDVILAHYPAEIYPHGITITYVAISTSAAVSDTHVLEEWTTSVIASATQTTVHSLALSTAAKVESTSPTDGAMAADSYLNINLDGTTDNIDWLIVTIGYYVNPGD